MARPNGLKFYDGPSMLDGSPIVGVAIGFTTRSKNTKTGDMLQCYIVPRDESPHVAVKTGTDRSVCGDCPLRPTLHRLAPVEDWPCYVVTFRGPYAAWAYAGQSEPTIQTLYDAPGRSFGIRLGAWGDPAAIPLHVWRLFLATVAAGMRDRHGAKRTVQSGYTHQWRTCDPAWSRYVMASVHTEDERQRAKGRGFRTFRIIGSASEVGQGEILCPNTTHGVQCVDCGLCNGSTGDNDGRKDIAIVAHR